VTDLAVGAAPESRGDGRDDAFASSYRPELDGVRAVAVFLVVFFHSGIDWFAGGFIGVDIFFVLSGFLVTQLLLRDVDRFGRIRFGRFYSRRYRRLLPAGAFTLIITAILYSAIAAPGQASASLGAFKAAFLYVANWFFIRQSGGYFSASVSRNPVLHFWSLAVEEQFYVVWPLILASLFALTRSGRRRRAMVRTAIALAMAASLAWALVLQGANVDRAYYGTDARAYQLLAGALLALTPAVVTRLHRSGRLVPLVAGGALAGLVVLATSLFTLGPITRGVITAMLTVMAIAALGAGPKGLAHRALSSTPVVYLGKISYGIYLWHWPVILVALAVAKPSPLELAGLTVLVATGLASASFQLLEMPIRTAERLNRHRFAVIATGLAISLIGALAVIPSILDRSRSTTSLAAGAVTAGFTPVPRNLDLGRVFFAGFGSTVTCSTKSPNDCTVVHGHRRHILLMGDSNAEMLVPAFESLASANRLTLSLEVTAGCPWQRGTYAYLPPSITLACKRNKEDAYKRVIPALHPDLIVLVNAGGLLAAPGGLNEATRSSLDQLKAAGRKLVLVDPVLQSPMAAPLQCLQHARFLEDCRFIAPNRPRQIDLLYQSLADTDSSVIVANLDRLICPYLPICDPVIGGVVVRWDQQHITAAYSATLGPQLATYFKALKLIPA
jgi:peptidoglycan/LPS O-acetylase OafA/YrhL